jgi:hypothetical protein
MRLIVTTPLAIVAGVAIRRLTGCIEEPSKHGLSDGRPDWTAGRAPIRQDIHDFTLGLSKRGMSPRRRE